ncbi:hypothetical protein SAMD00019534_025700 [Acytostelium subglobosum LB1]|uniref:hypothetical protein n=1 Tax=Acytostelium subglobosum LB1 TaxID=1410327 RepID=UPI000644E735|nr:hypothetical protein SAMD00019534_025700 [Acytostelium subglobosum LB1]GAM19395.1 hypothetical protein SAMD00019534_025700 [Acytostelium subglobosum LB1]|eukprot:XP_012757322.1 hypothetical protein SAMD00019534_025700 [Acytostelium subglobosum LB1]
MQEAAKALGHQLYQDHYLITILTTFGNGCGIIGWEQDFTGDTALALRMIKTYFFPGPFWSTFLSLVGAQQQVSIMGALGAVKLHSGKERVTIFLGIDECNRAIEHQSTKPRYFQNMVNSLCDCCLAYPSNNIFLVPLLCGTLHLSINDCLLKSSYPPHTLPIGLLSDDEIVEMIDSLKLDNWRNSRPFRLLLSDMGGLPRAVELLLKVINETITEARKKNYEQSTLETIDYSQVFSLV